MTLSEKLVFEPNIHHALWGEESWEISAHKTSPSVISEGNMTGQTLDKVLPDFPLLIKVITAKKRLSVQVHPNEKTAIKTNGEPKTEMWCLLEQGTIYAGLKPGISDKDVNNAVNSGEFENLLVKHEGEAGDVFFIPGGLVHAIGDNVKLYEVQQSSNTTYRLYDWGRVGEDGKPRTLHIAESLKTIDFSLPPPTKVKSVECPFFSFHQIREGDVEETIHDITIVYQGGCSSLVPKGTVINGPAFITTY